LGEGGGEIIGGKNVLTSLIFVIIEHENLELLNGYKFTGAFALLLTS
jgi:hypothetical protein